ncbi:unnamed protein product [Cylicocyclus nassatus]|uniref:Uncharacterized protein n=1 Tax=Cylicocyclus nassatus TaxID=53992 RepID=A0AA36H1I9_CYLNA|nr:unnamed protein product [Cylicocyclus nassatus]
MYSTLLQYSIRFLPRKLAPTRNAVTLWKRSEIVQRRSDGSHRGQEQIQRRGYPWSASSQDYIPIIIRSHLRGRWMKEYAKIKVKKNCSRLDALYVCNHTICIIGKLEICKEKLRKQLSFLFVQWMAKIYRKDPQPDPRRLNPVESELQRLLAHYRDVRSRSKVLRLPIIHQYSEEDPYVRALENYLKMFQSDEPFQFCHLAMPNDFGNIIKLKFLRTPIFTDEQVNHYLVEEVLHLIERRQE